MVRQIVIIILGLGALVHNVVSAIAVRMEQNLYDQSYQPNVTGGLRLSWTLPVLKLHESRVHSTVCYSVGAPFFRSESSHVCSQQLCFAFACGRWRSLHEECVSADFRAH